MVVVNFRGTSGSGKTYAARRVMDLYGSVDAVYQDQGGRPRLVGHRLEREGGRPLHVLGRYNGPECGGCDGLSWPGAVEFMVQSVVEAHTRGEDVMLEGLLVSTWGTERLVKLSRAVGGEMVFIHLNTSLEDCLAAVRVRREGRGNLKPLDPSNTESKWRGVLNGSRKLRDAGCRVVYADREGAFTSAREALGF